MAERRMFAKTIVLSDSFLDMPLSTRCLYFTLGMFADDDGFVNSPKGIMRQCGATEDDLRILLAKRFLISFDDGVIVIKHWRINNYLRNDRYQSTKYSEDMKLLKIEANGAYTEINQQCEEVDFGIPNSGIPSIGKVSMTDTSYPTVVPSSTVEVVSEVPKSANSAPNKVPKSANFTPPTLEEVRQYIAEKGYHFRAEDFWNYYESVNWFVGKKKMSKWKSACWTFESRHLNDRPQKQSKFDVIKEWGEMYGESGVCEAGRNDSLLLPEG